MASTETQAQILAGLTPSQTKVVEKALIKDGFTEQADPSKKSTAKKAPAETAAQKAADQAKETKSLESEIADGPWAKISSALVSQYNQEAAPVQAAVSGSTGASGQAAAANQALASLGLSSGSSAAQWLQSNMASAQATAAPVSAAMSAYGSQYAAEAGPITKALNAYGQANELNVAYAPEQAWLNALASHVTSNLSYYGEVPTASVGSIPSGVAEALQQSGGYPGSTASGLTPLSSLTPTAGGGVAVPKASAATEATAAAGGGVVPGTGVNAGSG